MKKTSKKIHKYIWDWNIANFMVAVFAAIFAGLALWWVWPRQAMPTIADIRLYSDRNDFLCRFTVRNDGDRACELEKYEMLPPNKSFQFAHSVCHGRTVMGGPPPPMITSSTLPVYIGRNTQQEVVIIGRGGIEISDSSDLPKEISIKVTFNAERKNIVVIKKVMVTRECFSNMTF